MTMIRRFYCNDLLRFPSINLDHLTETFNISFYMTYLARWLDYFHVAQGPKNLIMGYSKVEGQGESWHVTAVTVALEYRRQQLAKKLMNLLEDISDNIDKAYFVDLFVRASNAPTIKMYEKIEPILSGNLPPGFDSSTCRSVYVGNIHPQVIESLLQELFSNAGALEGCKLIRKEKLSYGFMDYFDPRSAAFAIVTSMGGTCHFNIFVGDLSPEVTDSTLFACFSIYPSCLDLYESVHKRKNGEYVTQPSKNFKQEVVCRRHHHKAMQLGMIMKLMIMGLT